MSTPFRIAHATGENWRQIAETCLPRLAGPPATLGFLYLTDLLADHADEIIAFLRQKTGVSHWVGSVGIGICATGREYLDVPAMVVMLADEKDGETDQSSSDEDYLKAAYRVALGRDPDEGGAADNLTFIQDTGNRKQMLRSLLESVEFKNQS